MCNSVEILTPPLTKLSDGLSALEMIWKGLHILTERKRVRPGGAALVCH